MKLRPRPYQVDCVDAIYEYFREKEGNPLCVLPTGTGKSVCIAMFLESMFAQWANQRVMVLTHVKELIAQNYEKLITLWPGAPAGINSSGLKQRDFRHPIIFAGIGSVWKMAAAFGKLNIIIIDECHLVSPKDATMYMAFINACQAINPHLKVIGFTATPWRLGHGHLTDPFEDAKGKEVQPLFTDVCFDMSTMEKFNSLIDDGYLAPLYPKSTKFAVNGDSLHMRGGEYIPKELQALVDKEEITEAALKEVIEYVGTTRKKWLVFAAGVDHAINVGHMLTQLGISNIVIHSKMTDAERDKGLKDFKAGKYQAAVNNNVLTTGFDDPEIDLIIILRHTASSVLWVQMLGRGTRPIYAPGFPLDTAEERLVAMAAGSKPWGCLVMDFAKNSSRLGPINDPVIPNKAGKGGGMAPIWICDCGFENHASARKCKACGAEHEFQIKFSELAATDELIKADLPEVVVFKVDHITYSLHTTSKGGQECVKASYYCKSKRFDEFVLFDHTDPWSVKKVRAWWTLRSAHPVPICSRDALELCETAVTPVTHLRVWVNKKYPDILAFCFDGTAFNTEEPKQFQGSIDTRKPAKREVLDYDLNDEIPF